MIVDRRQPPYSAVQNTSLRLFIIGHYHKGKTTLLNRLRGQPAETTFDQGYRAQRIRSDGLNGPPGPLTNEGAVWVHLYFTLRAVELLLLNLFRANR